MLGEDIKSRSFARFYFLYGSEKFILDFYVGQMIDAILPEEAKTFDLHWHDGKELSAGDFVSEMEAFPMLAEKKVVAIKDLPLQSETAKALLADPGILNDDTVLLVYASREDYDRTKKEFKEFLAFAKKNGKTAVLDAMDRTDKERWVRKHVVKRQKEISAADISYFLDSVDNDMYAMISEIEKLCAYAGERQRVTRSDIDAVCMKTAEAKVYELTNAITEKNAGKALSVIKTLFDNGENANLVSAALFNAVALFYRTGRYAAEGMAFSEIVKKTGGRDFVVKKNLNWIRMLPKGALEAMLEYCAQADLLLKTGSIDPRTVMEQLAVQCISAQNAGGRK